MENNVKYSALVGKTLDNRYKILEVVGVGGMAVVYKARDNQENRIVAIKILKEEKSVWHFLQPILSGG